MQLVENVLGNSNDPAWKARLADATIDTLELSQWDAQKNRLRKDTRNGQAIAVSLDRNAFLHDGDILLWDEKTKQAVICKIDLCEVLIIDLSGLQKLPADKTGTNPFGKRCRRNNVPCAFSTAKSIKRAA